jgi:hypothetical protein
MGKKIIKKEKEDIQKRAPINIPEFDVLNIQSKFQSPEIVSLLVTSPAPGSPSGSHLSNPAYNLPL